MKTTVETRCSMSDSRVMRYRSQLQLRRRFLDHTGKRTSACVDGNSNLAIKTDAALSAAARGSAAAAPLPLVCSHPKQRLLFPEKLFVFGY